MKKRNGETVNVREIMLEDEKEARKRAKLWAASASAELKVGDQVNLKDVIVNYSEFHKSNVLSV